MRVFSQINKCQRKKKRGGPLSGLAKSIYLGRLYEGKYVTRVRNYLYKYGLNKTETARINGSPV